MIPGAMIGGKYRLLRRLGRGAMGEVWAAVNEDTEREVALKLITSPDPELRRRLKREGRAIGRLEHPHIVQILDLGETAAGEPFLVMQRLSGETLADRLRRDRVLPPAVAAAIALDVARALRAAHDKQIVHRDLKPANIFLHREPDTDDDVVKVVDFGVSKMAVEHEGGGTVTGGIIGSPAYMSPEQIRGVGVDGRTDIWALGVMLFEMLSGVRPFPGMQPVVVLGQILSMPVPRVETAAPHVDAALGDVIEGCLERDPARRVANAAELAQRLRPFAPRGRFATVEDPSARERLTSFTSIPEMPSPIVEAAPGAPAQSPAETVREVPGARRALASEPAMTSAAAAPPPVSLDDHEGDVPTAVFQPAALLGGLAVRAKPAVVVPAPPTPGAGTVRMQPHALPRPLRAPDAPRQPVPSGGPDDAAGQGEGEATAVFRPTAALRAAAAIADAAAPPIPGPRAGQPPFAPEEPSTDESVRTTNEIDRTLPRAQIPSFAPSSGSWPKVEAVEPPSSDTPLVEASGIPPSSGSWPRPVEVAQAAPPSAPGVRAGPPPAPFDEEADADIDAPTAQMTPEARRQYRTTQPLDPALVPRSPAARNLTVPIVPGFLPPNPAAAIVARGVVPELSPPSHPLRPAEPALVAYAAPATAILRTDPGPPPYAGAAVTTTNSPFAASPLELPVQEAPFASLPAPAPAPRWHTALLVFSAVALVAAVVMLALTLSGDDSAAKAPPAGSTLTDATSPGPSASASAAASAPTAAPGLNGSR